MADVDIGYFSKLQARETWEVIKLLRSSGLLRNLSTGTPPDDPGIHHVWVKNMSGEQIPARACMQIDGTELVGNRIHLKVKKPTETTSQYIFNHDRAIPPGGYGMALPWGVVRMLGSGAAEANAEYGATVGAWTVQREDFGPFVVYGDDKDANVYKGRIFKTLETVLVEVVHDIIMGEDEITIKRKEIRVLSETDLADEFIPLTDCGEEDYYGA